VVLLGGEPGIGKSTLVLQCAVAQAAAGRQVLYVSGEESSAQIGQRALRLGEVPSAIDVLSESRFEAVQAAFKESRPALLIVDSIQTIFRVTRPTGSSIGATDICLDHFSASAFRTTTATGAPIVLP
jgi:DNA repair protein RadA/Sms